MHGIFKDEITAIPPTFGKEGVMIMYVVDTTSLYFGLITGLATYKTCMEMMFWLLQALLSSHHLV